MLVGATAFGQGASGKLSVAITHLTLPKGDVHIAPDPYPMSELLHSIAETEAVTIVDDGTKVKDLLSHSIRIRRHDYAY